MAAVLRQPLVYFRALHWNMVPGRGFLKSLHKQLPDTVAPAPEKLEGHPQSPRIF